MKAALWTKYGSPDGLIIKDVPCPTPKENEVLIKTYATTVTAGDCEIRRLELPFMLGPLLRIYFGLKRPKNIILGQEFSGKIVEVGHSVKRFKKGMRVFGTTGFKFGGYAEYMCLPENASDGAIAIMPDNMTFEQAAGVPVGAIEALHFLEKANIKRGETVLINGSGGSIGSFGIQIAKNLGATVIGVDTRDKFDLMTKAGAETVIDYQREDFTKNGQTYDVILDVVGKSIFSDCINCLNKNGRYLLANPKLLNMIRGKLLSTTRTKKVIFGAAEHTVERLDYLRKLIEDGKLSSFIDKKFTLDKIVEAHRYVETGKKKGNLIITIHAEADMHTNLELKEK